MFAKQFIQTSGIIYLKNILDNCCNDFLFDTTSFWI